MEVACNNETWTQRLAEYSSGLESRILDIKPNYDANFFEKKRSYVILSLDLSALVFSRQI
jgi:hypothetical protein